MPKVDGGDVNGACFFPIVRLLFYVLQLLQELDQHTSYVNSLCFNQDGSLLYSGDSCGNICVWNVVLEDDASLSGISFSYRFHHSVLQTQCLNCISFPFWHVTRMDASLGATYLLVISKTLKGSTHGYQEPGSLCLHHIQL